MQANFKEQVLDTLCRNAPEIFDKNEEILLGAAEEGNMDVEGERVIELICRTTCDCILLYDGFLSLLVETTENGGAMDEFESQKEEAKQYYLMKALVLPQAL